MTRDAWLPRVQSWLAVTGDHASEPASRDRLAATKSEPMLTPASTMSLRRAMAATMAAC